MGALRSGLSKLFPDEVLVDAMPISEARLSDLLPAESSTIVRAVDTRRNEFSAGRRLAHGLLCHLHVERTFPLLNGPDRAPMWPPGVVGTIAHGGGLAVVAVAQA